MAGVEQAKVGKDEVRHGGTKETVLRKLQNCGWKMVSLNQVGALEAFSGSIQCVKFQKSVLCLTGESNDGRI